ncbi:hypothetical protein A2U01_0025682, partial [Trifolium medium]|nr:hypothetical protein [Trifolium medium]
MDKDPREAKALVDRMAENHEQWNDEPFEQLTPHKVRSGKQLKDPKPNSPRTRKKVSNKDVPEPPQDEPIIISREEFSERRDDNDPSPKENENVVTPPSSYKPPVPFPQRLAKAKVEEQIKNYVKMTETLNLSVPLFEAIREMPHYAKFLKDVISNKKQFLENETVALSEECSALLLNKMPPKLKDPGSFSIPVEIGPMLFKNALCDLGASVSLMPTSV